MDEGAGPVWLQTARVGPLAAQAEAAPAGWLSEPEQRRLGRITSPARRAQFLAGRLLARRLLATAHGGDAPPGCSLSAPDEGPPRLQDAQGRPLGWQVALSHSGDHVACALARVPVGLDLEAPARRRDVQALARLVCTAGEQSRLDALDEPARERHFYCIWTLKEAWFKQRGRGLSPHGLALLHTAPRAGAATDSARVWQGGGLTLALTSDAAIRPQWASGSGPPGPAASWSVAARNGL